MNQTIQSWDDHEKTEEHFFEAFKASSLTTEQDDLVCSGCWTGVEK